MLVCVTAGRSGSQTEADSNRTYVRHDPDPHQRSCQLRSHHIALHVPATTTHWSLSFRVKPNFSGLQIPQILFNWSMNVALPEPGMLRGGAVLSFLFKVEVLDVLGIVGFRVLPNKEYSCPFCCLSVWWGYSLPAPLSSWSSISYRMLLDEGFACASDDDDVCGPFTGRPDWGWQAAGSHVYPATGCLLLNWILSDREQHGSLTQWAGHYLSTLCLLFRLTFIFSPAGILQLSTWHIFLHFVILPPPYQAEQAVLPASHHLPPAALQ